MVTSDNISRKKRHQVKTDCGQENNGINSTSSSGQAGVVIIGGHFQGLGLLRSFGRKNVPVYLLDSGFCIARFSKYTHKFSKCPDVREETVFLEFLEDLAREEHLEGWLLYPNDDETVRFLAIHKERLEEYYRVTTPPWDVVKFACEKMMTYKLAEKCGIAVPITAYPRSAKELEHLDIEFPVIIKPSEKEPFYSRIKKKAILVENKSQLSEEYNKAAAAIKTSQVLMVQELIPGGTKGLFSVGSLCRDGDLLAKVMVWRHRQHPMDFGHATTYAETVNIPVLEEMTRKILAEIGYSGICEVEFMLDPRDGRYKLIEINARAWGWHSIATGAGVDLPYLSYLSVLGERINQNSYTTGVKWLRLLTDIPTAFTEIFKGRMKYTDYLRSLKGKKEFAVLSLRDPMPFLMELVLLPYLWKKRGF